jgi:hypothetical protein
MMVAIVVGDKTDIRPRLFICRILTFAREKNQTRKIPMGKRKQTMSIICKPGKEFCVLVVPIEPVLII